MAEQIGRNVTAEQRDGKLVLTIDLRGETWTSNGPARSEMVASASAKVGEWRVGLNVYRKK